MRSTSLLFLAGVAAAGATTDIESRFKSWMTHHNKTYESKDEYSLRLSNFAANHNRTLELAVENPGAEFGETKFSDLTFNEFKHKFLTYRPSFRSRAGDSGVLTPPTSTAKPDAFDWTDVNGKKYITPVKDQMDCGSCWVFSALSNVESQYMIKHDKTEILSMQEVTSCENSGDSAGCEGGFTEDAMDYVRKNGISREADYPYVSGLDDDSRKCVKAKKKPIDGLVVKGFGLPIPGCWKGSCANQDEDKMAAGLAEFGPLSICVGVQDSWMFYNKGVLSGKCSGNANEQNHCVQMTAYDLNDKESSSGTWTLRNSWGDEWGEKGFMRLPFGVNSCGVADDPIYAIMG